MNRGGGRDGAEQWSVIFKCGFGVCDGVEANRCSWFLLFCKTFCFGFGNETVAESVTKGVRDAWCAINYLSYGWIALRHGARWARTRSHCAWAVWQRWCEFTFTW